MWLLLSVLDFSSRWVQSDPIQVLPCQLVALSLSIFGPAHCQLSITRSESTAALGFLITMMLMTHLPGTSCACAYERPMA